MITATLIDNVWATKHADALSGYKLMLAEVFGGKEAGKRLVVIDVISAGIGDRHFDLYWATWSLQFNLKTDRYRRRFLDAYGADLVSDEMLRTIAAVEVFG